jgi:hypothetical protein
MRPLYGLRYSYYWFDRNWSGSKVRGAPASDTLVFIFVTLWFTAFILGWTLITGPHRSMPKWATSEVVWEVVGGGVFLALASVWIKFRDRVVAAVYREFEPTGVPLPTKVGVVLRTFLLPIIISAALSVPLLARQNRSESHPYGTPPSGPPDGTPPSGGSSSR